VLDIKNEEDENDLPKLNEEYESEEFKQCLVPKKEKFKSFLETEIPSYDQEEIINSADALGIDG